MQNVYNELSALTVVNEKPVADIMRKQKSIYRLFPQFDDRVDAVRAAGGVDLVEEGPDTWKFTIASATEAGKKYTAVLHFSDLPGQIQQKAKNRALWVKDGSRVDYNKLAAAIIDDVDVKIDHTDCPAYNWWGQKYINTQRATAYRDPQNIRPKDRNPKEYGALCKHLQVLFEQLPFYTSTFAKLLKRYHSDTVAEIEKSTKKTVAGIGRAADFLGKRQDGGDAGPTPATLPKKPVTPSGGDQIKPTIGSSNDVEPAAKDKKGSPKSGVKPGVKDGVKNGVKPAAESVEESNSFDMPIFENDDPFKNTTGVPVYDRPFDHPDYARKNKNEIGLLIELRPLEYFEICVAGFGTTGGTMNQREMLDYASGGSTEKLKTLMLQGTKIDRPALEYRCYGDGKVLFGQEGRHRMKAAMDAGFDKVKVAVIVPADPKDREKTYGVMPGWFSHRIQKQIGGK